MTQNPARTRRAAAEAAAPAKPATKLTAAGPAPRGAKTGAPATREAKTGAPAKPAASRTRAARRRTPAHEEIAERAYYIHLEQGTTDELGNWLRAEQELMAA